MSQEDQLDEIEDLLGRAHLRQPSPQLDARVMRTCRRSWFAQLSRGARAAAWSAAAGLAIAAGSVWAVKHFAPHTKNGTPLVMPQIHQELPKVLASHAPKPLSLVRTVSNLTNEGIVGTAHGVPVRRFRRQSVQQVFLLDPQRGSHVAFTVPREEIVVVRMRVF